MSSIAFRNVRVFDGTHHQLTSAQDVVVADGVITSISDAGHPADQVPADIEIDGAGHTLMPGLIDMHTHLSFANVSQLVALTSNMQFLSLVAARGAEDALLRGFTSVRDVGGPVFGLKQAIDLGLTPGPRVTRRVRSSRRPAATATSGCLTRFRADPTATSATPS